LFPRPPKRTLILPSPIGWEKVAENPKASMAVPSPIGWERVRVRGFYFRHLTPAAKFDFIPHNPHPVLLSQNHLLPLPRAKECSPVGDGGEGESDL